MNEQIRLLAEQADATVLGTISGKKQYTFLEQDLEKFAQLIVAECAELFVDRRYMVLNPTEPFADERVRVMKQHDNDTVKTIKQHFGVEE